MRSARPPASIPYWTANVHCLNSSRCGPCDALVASGGTAPACLANARYGSPDPYADCIAASPDNAAAMPNSCWDQSTYAIPCPGGGLINPRNQTLGPKIYFELLGWLRPVRDRNAERIVRLRPSLPTARSFKRRSDSELRNSRNADTAG